MDIKENGQTAVENALLKASGYYKVINIPTFAGDTGMYIEGLERKNDPVYISEGLMVNYSRMTR